MADRFEKNVVSMSRAVSNGVWAFSLASVSMASHNSGSDDEEVTT